MGNSTHGLPYPDTGSSVDVPRDVKALADAADLLVLPATDDPDWVGQTLLSGWVAFSATYAPPRIIRRRGRIEFDGLVKGGATGLGTPLVNLASKYWPDKTLMMATYGQIGACALELDATGHLILGQGSFSATFLSLHVSWLPAVP